MELNPYLHYWIHEERRADAMRDAERWRQIKSMNKDRASAGAMRRLALRLRALVTIRVHDGAGVQRHGTRQTASSPTS